jgi:hypothetical protein
MVTKEKNHAIQNARGWLSSIREMIKGLESEDGPTRDEADTAIMDSPLSIEVRDGWRTPGGKAEGGPDEYRILLTTGGPALRLIGTLEDGTPTTVRMEWQDWGTPWTAMRLSARDEAACLAFASRFYFGE